MSERDATTAQTDGGDDVRMSRLSRVDAVYLLLVVVVGAAVRLYHIGWQPLWLDEAFSEWVSRQSVSYLWSILPTFETNPPLYYGLLKAWRTLFGDSEAALRALSTLFGLMTIPVVYAMGRMLGAARSGPMTGLIAAAIFALSPIHVQYAQEARAYAMLVFAVALAMSGLMWAILHPSRIGVVADRAGMAKGGIPWPLGLLALGLASIMWSHDTGAFAVLAIALPCVYWWVTDARCSLRAFIALSVVAGVALLLLGPYLVHLVGHLGAVNRSFWIAAPNFSTVTETVIAIYGTPTKEGFTIFAVMWALGAFGIHAIWQRGLRSIAVLLVSVGLLPVLLALLVSVFAMPIFLGRTLIYVNVPLYVVAAYAITRIPSKSGVAAAIVAGVGMFAIALGSYYRDFNKREPWNEITAYLSSFFRQGEPVLLLPNYVYLPLEYYVVRQGAQFQRIGLPIDWRSPGLPRNPDDPPPRTNVRTADLKKVSELTGNNRKFGLVTRFPEIADPAMLVQQEIMKTHRAIETKRFENITVEIFEAR